MKFVYSLGILLMSTLAAWASLDGFEVSDGYNNSPNQSLLGLPNAGTTGDFNGPWVNNSSIPVGNGDFQSSNGEVQSGTRSLELKRGATDQPGRIEVDRALDPGLNGGLSNPVHEFSVFAFIPAKDKNSRSSDYFMIYTGTMGSTPSAAFMAMQPNSTSSEMHWYVWDNGQYVDTQVAVSADNWQQLTLRLDVMAQTYTAYVDGQQVVTGTTLNFGSVNASTNVTGVGFAMVDQRTANRSIFFDSLSVKPRAPEVSTWISLAAFMLTGLVPIWVFRRAKTNV
jgi:hypothetical protein